MKLVLEAMVEAVDFKSKAEDIKDAVEEAYLADVAEVDLVVEMKEEESIDAIYKMLECYNVMTDHSLRFIRHMTPLTRMV